MTWKISRIFFTLCAQLRSGALATEWMRKWKENVEKIFHNLLNVLRTWSRKAPNIFQYSMHFLFVMLRVMKDVQELDRCYARSLKCIILVSCKTNVAIKIVLIDDNNNGNSAREGTAKIFAHSSSEFMLSFLMHLHNDVVECFNECKLSNFHVSRKREFINCASEMAA